MIEELIEKYFNKLGEQQMPMAASPIALNFCIRIIKQNKLKKILDAGSGLSSVLFHYTFKEVTTIDDSRIWAEITKSFIQENIQKDISIGSLDEIISNKFDFIFYDYGNIETRIFNFKKLLKSFNGFIYLDDMHVSYYREYIIANTRSFNLILLQKFTKDKYGRYGALLLSDNYALLRFQ